jgi:hypothetical protein
MNFLKTLRGFRYGNGIADDSDGSKRVMRKAQGGGRKAGVIGRRNS